MLVKVENPEAFVRRAFFLLWQACRGPSGMGYLQDNPEASEDDVFTNVQTSGDYPGTRLHSNYYGDYVFGRMMKWGCEIKDGLIDIVDKEFQLDYQGFSHRYKTNEAIVKATARSLDVSFEVESS